MEKKAGNINLLCYVKPIMIALGALPYQLVSVNKRSYTFYKYVLQGTFFLVLIFFYMEIPRFHGPMDKLFQSVSILVTYTILYLKGLVCMSKNMSTLIVDMVSYEENFKNRVEGRSDKRDVFNIYSLAVKRSKMVQMFYIILTYLTGVSFFQKALNYAMSSEEIKFNSIVEAHESLPYAMWLPLDEKEHYLMALGMQTFCALLAINYYCFVQCILVILPLHVTLRLKILGDNLENLKFSRKEHPEFGDAEHLDYVKELITLCIKEHIAIINNCSTLNNTIKYLMLLEFLMSSAQISLALILLTTANETNAKLFAVIYLFQLMTQLLILYWHGDEIREQSVIISDVIYGMQWYEYNKSINTSFQIMMIRSQKPLSITLGPFGEISLAMALKIMKAAYTYVMFMKQVYE